MKAQVPAPTVNRDRGIEMLRAIKQDLKDYYYDPGFRGINLDEHFKAAEQKVKQAKSSTQIFGIVGQVLIDFNDSHTSLIPPTLVTGVDYGWDMQVFGDRVFVTEVTPESDAAKKGLKVGDEIHSVDGFELSRANLWEFEYSYRLMPALRMSVTLREGGVPTRRIDIESRITEKNRLRFRDGKPPLYFEPDKQTMVCKLQEFHLSDNEVDEMMKRCGKYQNLILDLRGNPGGKVKMLQRLIGYFFDHNVTIGETKSRNESRAEVAKTRGDRTFKGRLIVLVDSTSTSASEVFARVIQLEKRGQIIGDQTGGKVMTSLTFGHSLGYRGSLWDGPIPPGQFGVSITVSDLIMSDGKSLEKVGVTPDKVIVPTARQLADRHDPVLSRAASIFEINLDPQKAGAIFPAKDQTESSNKKQSGEDK